MRIATIQLDMCQCQEYSFARPDPSVKEDRKHCTITKLEMCTLFLIASSEQKAAMSYTVSYLREHFFSLLFERSFKRRAPADVCWPKCIAP